MRLARFRTRFADTMALYFLGQVASANSLFMADAVRGVLYFVSNCIKKKSNILGKKTAKTAQKQGKKEVISTGCYYTLTYELDLLIMAIIVVLVTNLIYLQEK